MADPPVLAPHEIPPFVTTADEQYRWRLAMGVATMIAGRPDRMLAEIIYRDPRIPTHESERQVQEARYDPSLHPRGRGGKWIDVLGRLKALGNIGPSHHEATPLLSEEVMRSRGYDRLPSKGPEAEDMLGDFADTSEKYRLPGDLTNVKPEYRYTPERMADVHDPIVQALVGPHASQEHPHALIVCGGPASGKSTLLRQHPEIKPPDAVHLDADEIRAGGQGHHGIPEAVDMLEAQDPYAALGSHREAGDIFEKAEQAAIDKRANLVMDQTGDGNPDIFERQLKRLHDDGYTVDMVYVTTPTARAVAQNIYRAQTEHRYVPTPVVRAKHRAVARNFRDKISKLPYIGNIAVYDPEFGLIGYRDPNGQMVAEHEKGWKRFMAQAEEPDQTHLNEEERRSLEEATHREPTKGPVIEIPFELEDRETAWKNMDELFAQLRQAEQHKKQK